MNSRKLKKMASEVVKVSKRQFLRRVNSTYSKGGRNTDQCRSSLIRSDLDQVDVIPKGFMAVYVGPQERRFVIPMRYLSVPDFKAVMEMAADEFGYEQEGGLRIPCDEDYFENLLAACKFKSRKSNSYSALHFHAHPTNIFKFNFSQRA